MTLAIISDIHSNYYALKAVLEQITEEGADNIICAGDIIGYYSMPNEVIQLLKEYKVQCIQGNHDAAIIAEQFDRETEKDFPKVLNFEALLPENKDWLNALPLNFTLDVAGYKMYVCHGSPEDICEYLYEDTNSAQKAMDSTDCDILVCGHTHLPYSKFYDGRFLINSGSVGKPKDGTPDATYVTVHSDDGMLSIDIHHVAYDVEKMVTHAKEFAVPEKHIQSLIEGK